MYIKLNTNNENSATMYTTAILNFQDPDNFEAMISKDDVQFNLDNSSGIKISGSQLQLVISTIQQFGKEIQTGFTKNGLDTTKLTEDQAERAEMLDIHPALYDMYFTRGGVSYRCHMSQREKTYMIREYQNEQNILDTLQSNSYKELIFPNTVAGKEASQNFVDTLNINL